MCGISGIINTQQQDIAVNGITAMTDIVRHRGPNDEGFVLFDIDGQCYTAGGSATPAEIYSSEVPYKPQADIAALEQLRYNIALGHRRLSILDLSVYGHCPMSYQDGRYWITYNGEIYNFNDLKEELILLGHEFISHTDTEVILAAYAQWGTECLHKFHGMWAFAVYDAKTKELFLSRDRFGIKPLYYWVSPGGSFCFASEIKQFTVLPGWKAKLNGQRAYDYLMYNMTDHTAETMFTGVYHIPGGHYLKVHTGSLQLTTGTHMDTVAWYQPTFSSSRSGFAEAADTFRNYFRRSVKENLVSDVTVGSALSGGLDSSAIVCEVEELLKGNHNAGEHTTFSYCSDDMRYNEKKWVEEVIEFTGASANYVYENDDEIFDKASDLLWYNDEPNQSHSELATYQVYQAANKKNIRVLLSGQGADEYLSGYEAFNTYRRLQLLKKGRFAKLNKELETDGKPLTFSSKLKYYTGLCYFLVPVAVRSFFGRKRETYTSLKAVLSFGHLQSTEKHPFTLMKYNRNSIFDIAHRQLLYYPLPKYLRYEDRMSMCNSVEARVPFLDHRLTEFVTGLPAAYLDAPFERKRLMVQGLTDILPGAIRERKDKIGFITSEEMWVKSKFTGRFRKMLEESIDNAQGVIRPSAITYYDEMATAKRPFDYSYWRLIAFGLWMKKFEVQL